MSAILQKSTNYVQSQSHRVYPQNWEGDGWVAVPLEFEEIAVANSPYIKVTYADDGETITNIEAAERPDPEPEPEPVDLAAAQQARQIENKAALAEWLVTHPLQWTDGRIYGVTEEDQQEMALNLMQYQVSVQAGQPAVLEWHAQKESCRTFEQSEYVALSLAIADYVYPYLRYQESVKEQIYQAETAQEVSNVKIDYASVSG